MKKITLGCLVLLLLVCGLPVTLWALPSLLPPTVRTPPVDMRDLMVDATPFPPDWRVVRGPEPQPERSSLDWGDENLSVGLQPTGDRGFASHYVFKFRNEAAAMYGHFWILRQGVLFPSHRESKIPAEWTYRSPIADDWRFACVDYGQGKRMWCAAMARYDEYISVLNTTVSSEYMTLKDLEGILRAIDERMAQCLGKLLPTAPAGTATP
ncbi:MAG: hypothetical protein H5T64_09245 [Chloroflexi bacterium]|nr:hypothetical protein [Chloroflexota bacterium]